jgi:hypothetical protein
MPFDVSGQASHVLVYGVAGMCEACKRRFGPVQISGPTCAFSYVSLGVVPCADSCLTASDFCCSTGPQLHIYLEDTTHCSAAEEGSR